MRIAIIAHDGKKPEMVRFLMNHRDFLSGKGIDLVATGTTGQHARNAGLEVETVMSGPLGGDAQIAAQVTEDKIEMVFFFRDPMGKHAHEPDIMMLMRICDVKNIPLATNPATAERLLLSIK